jgi:hypothetical protein
MDNELETREGGPDVLLARVQGNSIADLKLAALDQARELYGPDAELRIVGLDNIATSTFPEDGKFRTTVTVRCLNFPDEDR